MFLIGGIAELKESVVAESVNTLGLTESKRKSEVYNSGFIAHLDGSIRVIQTKIYMIPKGKSEYGVIDIDVAKIGCVMCNDIFYPEVVGFIALQAAKIIFAPSTIGGRDKFQFAGIQKIGDLKENSGVKRITKCCRQDAGGRRQDSRYRSQKLGCL